MDEVLIYEVLIEDGVSKDIDELSDYYKECAGSKSAERFEKAIEEAISSLTVWPKGHMKVNAIDDLRKYNMTNHKVSIIYLVDDVKVEVLVVKVYHNLKDEEQIMQMINSKVKDIGL